jgi:sarcosine oxidase
MPTPLRYAPRVNAQLDAVVVGGGVMGTAAARTLATRGRSVRLLERYEIGHVFGSSGGPTRNYRLTYHDPVYVRMARAVLERWRRLEEEGETELLRVVGGLDFGPATDVAAAALEAAGETFTRPSVEEINERWPALRIPEGMATLFQAEGAIIRADAAVAAQAHLAREAGADHREGVTVTDVRSTDDGVEVTTSDGEQMRATTAIVAAGAWTASLLEPNGIRLPLRPLLEQSTVFGPDPALEGLPTVIDWNSAPQQPPYLVPNAFVPGECKVGAHLSGPPIQPDEGPFPPDPEREARAAAWIGRVVASAPAPVESTTCLYTVSPDEDFVIDRVGPLVVASPCSGHGFKFAPLIGEVLADLVTGDSPEVPVERFGLQRLAVYG